MPQSQLDYFIGTQRDSAKCIESNLAEMQESFSFSFIHGADSAEEDDQDGVSNVAAHTDSSFVQQLIDVSVPQSDQVFTAFIGANIFLLNAELLITV